MLLTELPLSFLDTKIPCLTAGLGLRWEVGRGLHSCEAPCGPVLGAQLVKGGWLTVDLGSFEGCTLRPSPSVETDLPLAGCTSWGRSPGAASPGLPHRGPVYPHQHPEDMFPLSPLTGAEQAYQGLTDNTCLPRIISKQKIVRYSSSTHCISCRKGLSRKTTCCRH